VPKPQQNAPPAKWNDQEVREIFASENDWSVEQFWWRNSMGLVDLTFEVYPWRSLPGTQADLDTSRGSVNSLVRSQAGHDGVPLSQYDHVCTILHPPPGDRGAAGVPGDMVVDEGPFSLEFFEHECGHLLGYEHAFGSAGDRTWQAYHDDFDVMGYSEDNDRAIPTPSDLASLSLPAGINFWRSGRRLSAASLYRYVDPFKTSSGVIRVPAGETQSVRLVALTKGRFGDPVIAIVSTPSGEITVEYRINFADDFSLRQGPVLVLHSIGRRVLPRGAHEVNPVVYEAQVSATIGSDLATMEGDVHAVITADGGGASTVTITITSAGR
jgi:hypothetical protein